MGHSDQRDGDHLCITTAGEQTKRKWLSLPPRDGGQMQGWASRWGREAGDGVVSEAQGDVSLLGTIRALNWAGSWV